MTENHNKEREETTDKADSKGIEVDLDIIDPDPNKDYSPTGSVPVHLANQLEDAEHLFESPSEARVSNDTDGDMDD
jgi:hypothetical protein